MKKIFSVLICCSLLMNYSFTCAHISQLSQPSFRISENSSFAEQNPTKAALAQVCFSHPFISSALLSTLLCMTYQVISKRKPLNILSDEFILSTLLGWPILFRLAHNYLINARIAHPHTAWCTQQCKHVAPDQLTPTLVHQIISVEPEHTELEEDIQDLYQNDNDQA